MRSSLSILALSFIVAHAEPVEISAILDTEKLPKPGQTLVWSPLFHASWDKLKANHTGKLLRVEPPNPLITRLENFTWKKDQVMPHDGYAVYAGPDTPEFFKQTAADIKKRFDYDLPPNALPQTGQGNAYYGILVRDLAFTKQFFRAKKKMLSFKDSLGKTHRVSFFGTAGKLSGSYGKNIQILANTPSEKSFILSINTNKEGEKVIIYKPKSPSSIDTAIQHVLNARSKPAKGGFNQPDSPHLWEGDVIKIPYLDIDTRTDLTKDLAGARYYEGESIPSTIARAYQITQFELFEKGARVRVHTGASDAFGGTPKPRHFICDGPFFVFTWRDEAKLPYFAAWIDGPNALTPFKPAR